MRKAEEKTTRHLQITQHNPSTLVGQLLLTFSNNHPKQKQRNLGVCFGSSAKTKNTHTHQIKAKNMTGMNDIHKNKHHRATTKHRTQPGPFGVAICAIRPISLYACVGDMIVRASNNSHTVSQPQPARPRAYRGNGAFLESFHEKHAFSQRTKWVLTGPIWPSGRRGASTIIAKAL